MCTATDMAVLCGGNGEVCYSKQGFVIPTKVFDLSNDFFGEWGLNFDNYFCTRYGSYPLRGKYCHEMALRILLACIEVYYYVLDGVRLF